MTKKELETALYYAIGMYCNDREMCGVNYEEAKEQMLEDLGISWKDYKHIEDNHE